METKYITPEHLKTLITVIDMVTERGALKGSELMTVSELRNNLTLELEFYVQEQQRLQQEAALKHQQELEAQAKLKEEQEFKLKQKYAKERLARRALEEEVAKLKMMPAPSVSEQERAELNTLTQAKSVEDIKSPDTGQQIHFSIEDAEDADVSPLVDTPVVTNDFSVPGEEVPAKPKQPSKARQMADLLSGRKDINPPEVTDTNVPTPPPDPMETWEEPNIIMEEPADDPEYDFEGGKDWIAEEAKRGEEIKSKEHQEWLDRNTTEDIEKALAGLKAMTPEEVPTRQEVQDEMVEQGAIDELDEFENELIAEEQREKESVFSHPADESLDDELLRMAQSLDVSETEVEKPQIKTYESVEELEQKVAEKNEPVEEFEEIVIPDADDLSKLTKAQIVAEAEKLNFTVDIKQTKQLMIVDFGRQSKELIEKLTAEGAEITTE